MADKRFMTTHNSLLDPSPKKSKLLTSNLSLTSSLLTSSLGGTTSSKFGGLSSLGSSSLLSKPSLLTGSSSLSLTSSLSLGGTKSNLETGLLGLSLQTSSKLTTDSKRTEKKKRSPRDNKTYAEPHKKSSPTKRSITTKDDKKKKAQSSSAGEVSAKVIKLHTIEPPDYRIQCDKEEEYMEVEVPDFIPPNRDFSLVKLGKRSLSDVTGLKRGLINNVSGSLISQPNFTKKDDSTRHVLTDNVAALVDYDPEFILKVALYSRKELNIRTTSNFLLALASSLGSCRQYLKKYYCACINLPSDWMEVAEIFQTLDGISIKRGALPAALRKVMITKFSDFDQYQLAKYNKASSGKKKNKKAMEKKAQEKAASSKRLFDSDSSDSEDEDDSYAKAHRQLSDVSYDAKVTEAELSHQKFTIKQLIRKLHITAPVEYVMCIIGKKYPESFEKFYQARLPGTFEEEKAGKRMKLPIPETWETQVSLKGNKAQTWEDLIDHKKLPFMAMLRNLRNLIKAGISEKHHNSIIRRLTDKRQVVNSRQFPFRFFSAYVVLQELADAYDKNQQDIIDAAVATESSATTSWTRKPERPRGRGQKSKTETAWWILKKKKKAEQDRLKEVPYDKSVIERYIKAVDTAVKIATTYNVQPIKGRTIILCDLSDEMDQPCSSAKGLGKPRTLREISTLMSLMCQHACESCTFIVYNDFGHRTIEFEDGLILDRLQNILDNMNTDMEYGNKDSTGGLPYDVLYKAFRDRTQVDNLLVFSQDIYPESTRGKILNDFLCQYRHAVNPNLLFMGMVFSSPRPGFDPSIKPRHENDIYISGYSDAILRFIAERGDSGLLQHVDKIDEAFQLRPMPKASFSNVATPKPASDPERGLCLTVPKPSWRTVRVFISSTFRDMHGERDLLTRFVFPELRSIGRKHFVNVYEVDLRWGITENESKSHQALTLCLDEVNRCQLFVGLLGERYGWIPDKENVPDTAEFDWVRDYDCDASVTELEMYAGALSKTRDVKDTAFFFLRDGAFESDVPKEFIKDFKAEDANGKSKIQSLKRKIKNSGLQVYDNYPCHWGGYLDGKPIVAGLEEFGANMLNTLVNAVKKLCPVEEEVLTEEVHINNQHWAAVEKHSLDFVGRSALIKQIIGKITSTSYGVIGLVGKAGCGKTALMAATIKEYVNSRQGGEDYNILINISGAAPGSNNLAVTLRRLVQLLNTRFYLGQSLPEDFKNLVVKFEDLLAEAANICTSKLIIFLDGVDAMESGNQPSSLEWLPERIPDNVVIVMTAVEGDATAKSLKRIGATEVNTGALDMWDKAEIVRQTLAKHRKALNESGFGNEMKLLMLKKDAHNPLFLKLACEELRVYGVFEKITDKLKSLPHTMAQMLQEIMVRLETEHGKSVICLCLSLLACARDGLTMEEMYDLVNWTKEINVDDEFHPDDILYSNAPDLERKIPPVAFAFLARSIMSFLNPSSAWSPVLSLGNAEVRTAVKLRYMKGSGSNWEEKIHKLLAGYFWRQVDPLGRYEFKGQDAKAFAQLPYHLACSHSFSDLKNVLCNHLFIQAKCAMGQAASLLDDFELKGSGLKEREAAKFCALQEVQQYKSFVSRNVEILVNHPALELQQALNEPNNSMPFQDANQGIEFSQNVPAHMLLANKPEEASQCFRTMSNLKMAATCIKMSPAGISFATGSQDAIVRLYDKDTGKELKSFMGHSDAITDICFVNNRILCSASADNTLSLWDTEFGHRVHTLKSHNRRVDACCADSSGRTVASGGWDGVVILWNAANGNSVWTFEIGSPVNSVDFHPEVELLAVGTWDSKIRIFNTLHRKRVAVLSGHVQSVRDVVFSKDGKHLASADMDGAVKIWDSKKGTVVGSVKGHSEPINKVLFSPTGKELITASSDHQVKVWSGDLGFPLHHLATDKLGPATSVAMTKDGDKVAIGYHSGTIRIHSVHTGVRLGELKACASPIRALHFHTDGKMSKYLFAGNDDGVVQVVDVKKTQFVGELVGHNKPVLCVTTFKDLVITGGEDCAFSLFKYVPGVNMREKQVALQTVREHIAPVTSVCFRSTEDDLTFITTSRDSSVNFYEIPDRSSGRCVSKKTNGSCHADWINAVSNDVATKTFATGSNDFNIKLWDSEDCTEKCTLSGHDGAVNSVAFEHGYIVSGSSDNTVKVWSHKGVDITTLHGHTLRVNACALYTNGTGKHGKGSRVSIDKLVVASAGDDGDVWLWKPLLANQLACLSGHSNRVLSVTADKDGHVTSCSLDGTVKMWTPRLSKEADVAVHDAAVNFIALSKGGRYAVSGSRDGVVKIWKYDENSCGLVMKFSYQAHAKSVTCGTFIKDNANLFVTGGNDSRLIEWEIVDQKNGFFVKEEKTHNVPGPFTAIHYGSQSGNLFVSDLFGKVSSVKASGSAEALIIPERNVIDSLATCMLVDERCPSSLLVATNHNYIGHLPFDKNTDPLRRTIVDTTIEDPETSYPPNWICCMAQERYTLFAGDSRGQIFITGPRQDEELVIKIHKSDITSIEVVGETVFTASKDATIKIWHFSLHQGTPKFQQVGQYFCSAPVTSMKVWNSVCRSPTHCANLILGDILGNVQQLKWQQPTAL